MYAMYPTEWAAGEWGPAKNDPDHPWHRSGFDLRDGDERQPEDN